MADSNDDAVQLLENLQEEFPDADLEGLLRSLAGQQDFGPGVKSRPILRVLENFKARKFEEVTSHQQYERKLNYIQTYLEDCRELDSTDQLTSEAVERYRDWRKYDSLERDEPLADGTLQDDLYLFREFIQYLTEHGLAPPRFERVIRIPAAERGNGAGVDTKSLSPSQSKAVLEYLRKFKWASVDHVLFELMCDAGPRKSDLHALDVRDFQGGNQPTLAFKYRDSTQLKNGVQSERAIDLFGGVGDVIQDYLDNIRPSTTDEDNREPLLTTGDGRMGKSTIKKRCYMWTRPCQIGEECPHDREPESCEAAQTNNNAFQCPSSRAPHHIRTGYITAKRDAGVPVEAISQRCDVSQRVMEKHYDLPDIEQERARHEDALRGTGDQDESGFSHPS